MTARTEGVRIVMARTDQLVLHPKNVRKEYGDLRELAESIAVHGVLEPLIVEDMVGKGRVLAGHRRLLAARQARVPRVPCVLRDPVPDDQAIALMVTENKHRLGLTKDEKTAAARSLLAYGWSKASIARGFGVSAQTVANWLANQAEDDPLPERQGVRDHEAMGVAEQRQGLVEKAAQRAAERRRDPTAPKAAGSHRAAAGQRAGVVSARLVRDTLARWEAVVPPEFVTELRRVLGDA